MKDGIYFPFYIYEVGDVVLDEFEFRIADEMGDVVGIPRKKIVYTNDVVAFGDKPVAKMRAYEARAAGDQDS